jgi:hypothetical protein
VDSRREACPGNWTSAADSSGIAHGIVPSVNLEIYQDGGVGEASLEFMKAVKQSI